MYSDTDISEALGRGALKIDPLAEKCLTPAGYDACVGDLAWIVQRTKKVDIKKAGRLTIPAHCTALVGTAENVALDDDHIGFVISKVSLCARGLSHISTSLDPGWKGPLLVPVHNWNDRPLILERGEAFCTLMFDKVHSTATESPNKPSYRTDITAYIDELDRQSSLRRDRQQALLSSPWTKGVVIAVVMAGTAWALNAYSSLDLSASIASGVGIGVVLATLAQTIKPGE